MVCTTIGGKRVRISKQQYAAYQQQIKQLQVIYLQRKILADCYAEMMHAGDALLKQGLEHPQAIYRYAAAMAAGKRNKIDFADKLAKMTTDFDLDVQQGARHGLVLLSKQMGLPQDFGPLRGCSTEQSFESMENWKNWFKTIHAYEKTNIFKKN